MRNAIRAAGVVAALLVCAASATSYSSSYKDTNLGGGMYLVSVEVNDKTSMSTAKQYAYRRAGEMCGSAGFTPIDAEANSTGPNRATTVYGTYGNTTTLHGGGHDVLLLYKCNDGRGAGGAVPGRGGAESLPRR